MLLKSKKNKLARKLEWFCSLLDLYICMVLYIYGNFFLESVFFLQVKPNLIKLKVDILINIAEE